MVIAIKLEKHVTSICIYSIIISTFHYWKEFYLVILLIVYDGLEIDFYYTILHFN